MPNSILDREQYGLGGLGSSLSKLGKKAIKKIDYDQVKTARGDKSKGRMTREDGSVYALMGDDMIKVAETRSELKGAGKAAAVAIPTSSLITSWLINNDEEPTKKELTAFEKAFRKAYDAGKDTFTFKGKLYTTEMREGKNSGGPLRDGDSPKPPKGHAPFSVATYKLLDEVQSGKKDLEDLSVEDREQVKFLMDALESEKSLREPRLEGSLMIPAEGIPVDTYTPEDQANAEETQLPDDEMEEDYIDFVLSEALPPEEQEYLMETLAEDSRLSQIFDKVVETASEFSGSGEVEGPGTGVSDSIPARLSDGEFVMTRKATDQIGADNLQRMMDDAERAYDGGLQRKNEGGLLSRPEEEENPEEEEINQLMMGANRMPSVR